MFENLSKCRGIVSSKPFSTLVLVVPNNDDHLVQDRSHLDATSKSAVGRLRIIASEEPRAFHLDHSVYFIEPWVGDNNLALGAGDSSTVEVVGNLIGL
jgi:hypothetical protein